MERQTASAMARDYRANVTFSWDEVFSDLEQRHLFESQNASSDNGYGANEVTESTHAGLCLVLLSNSLAFVLVFGMAAGVDMSAFRRRWVQRVVT